MPQSDAYSSKAIVIGSGFGGLALAIRLQSMGLQVTLLEARDRPGGRAYVYQQDGYTFDAGPTVITDPSSLEELFALSGRKLSDYVDLLPITPFYRLLWEDGAAFDYVNDQDELDRQIAAMSPRDVEGYREFLKYSQAVFEEGYLKLGHVAFLDPMSMVKAGPKLAQLQAWRSVYSIVSKYVKEEHLRQALSFHTLLVGGSPFASSSIYALIHALERKWGVWFPRGGTGALVAGMARLFQDLGGTLRTATPVEQILTEGDRAVGVRTKAGETLKADLVASNADVMHTYERLLSGHKRGAQMRRSLGRRRFSMSLFVVYFGLKAPPPADLRHHTILFGPEYKALVEAICGAKPLRDDFSIYLHAPSVTDDSLAPPGCSGYYALSPVPNLKQDIDWAVEGPAYADRLLEAIERRAIPGLRANLETLRIFTPEDFRTELNAHLGSAFSLEPILTQSAYFRVHNRDDVVRNLYFVGAGTHPGAGVPGVVGSAKATAGVIAQDLALQPA
ncbi:phytoene desaturase [Phenylobacterium deserti]|uniref:Phytoene desaturase (neurosporene-forming) n=1 Tax=Phenylobacterium deserti TaxID=1914756 RepID=A0A328ACG8_9CAUL|nr:phytoene desaturase [Phenylobacterium deserti]RAK52503.1 phytoene desaturase [Phenylobacterium deserti]